MLIKVFNVHTPCKKYLDKKNHPNQRHYLFKFAKIITIKISYFCLTEEHIYSVNNENVNIILKLMTFPEYF